MHTLSSEKIIEKVLRIKNKDFSEVHLGVSEKIKNQRKDLTKLNHRFLTDFLNRFFGKGAQNSLFNFNKQGIFLPEGTLFVDNFSNDSYVFVVQQKPQVRTLRFSSGFFSKDMDNFREKYYYDYEVSYNFEDRDSLRLAFPYIIFIVYLFKSTGAFGGLGVFYSNKPVTSLHDFVYYPNLPNCSSCGHVCLGFEGFSEPGLPLGQKIIEIINHFWGSQFNRDRVSAYRKMTGRDRRFMSIWEWERNTLENPEFVLNVNWGPYLSLDRALNLCFNYNFENPVLTEIIRKQIENDFGWSYGPCLQEFVKGICLSINPELNLSRRFLRELARYLKEEEWVLEKLRAIKNEKEFGEIAKGSIVKIRQDSPYYYQAPESEGEVMSDFEDSSIMVRGEPSVRVHFINGYMNRYREKDLELAGLGDKSIVKGSIVKIRKGSNYYMEAPDIKGEVMEDFGSRIFKEKPAAHVHFENGYKNYYNRIDLQLIEL